ncbi:MAG: polysaccharide pyruvyl transferase family protein [Bacteroidota bacterium]
MVDGDYDYQKLKKMAKINLLTIQWGESYGAILQTYATCKILENLGHEVTIINLLNSDYVSRFKRIRTYLSFNILKIIRFELFKRKNFPLRTKHMLLINPRLIPKADYVVVGSDQVWNSEITKVSALSFFLDFVPTSVKRVSLSSSFGKAIWNDSMHFTLQVKDEIQKFHALSVREESGVKICENTFHVTAKQLVDPTIALNDFSSFIPKNIDSHNDITCFIFIQNDLFKFVSEYISQKLNSPIRQLAYYTRNSSVIKKACYSPTEFLRNIAGASFVISDSFHGIVFSILFKKQFVVLRAIEDRFERISALMNMLHLEDRVILTKDDLEKNSKMIFNKIDYSVIDKILENKRVEFYNFVRENIS